MRKKITKATVDALRPDGGKAGFLWDTELRGYGFKRLPSGAGVFLCQYRHGGRVHRVKLGGYPPLTPDEARRLAKAALGRVAAGVNVAAERRAAKQAAADALTVRELGERFIAGYVNAGKVKAGTAEGYRRHLRKHLPDALGRRLAVEVRRADIARLHAELAEESGPFLANRFLSTVSKMYGWGELCGLLPEGHPSPTRRIERHEEAGRERRLTDAELTRLTAALDRAGGNPWALGVVRLLLLTGMHKGEALSIKWSDIADDLTTLRLTDAKAGPRTVWLSPQARALLASLPHMLNNPHVFPGQGPGKPLSSIQDVWAKLMKAAEIIDARPHDIRHTFASVAAEGGVPLPVLAMLLGHSMVAMTARYSHVGASPQAAAAEQIGDRLAKLMCGNVVPFEKASA